MRRILPVFSCALFSVFSVIAVGCADKTTKVEAEKNPAHSVFLKPVQYSDLPGYNDGDLQPGFMDAFKKSCAPVIKSAADKPHGPNDLGGTAADWQPACRFAMNGGGANEMLNRFFVPYQVYGDDGTEGLFTGYYEPLLYGSFEKTARYNVPLYVQPDNLVSADLGAFSDDLSGKTIRGKVVGNRLVPYDSRADIDGGSLAEQNLELVWVDDAVDAFFLHIQGSGMVELPDGERLRVGYAGQNGHEYFAIGRELIRRGALDKDTVSLQSIRQWLKNHPDQAQDLLHMNPSYIFFRPLTGDGPLGGQGVALTPEVSLAVDRRLIPYGAPIWLNAAAPLTKDVRLQQMMVAQDTGGAIRGAVRGDVFWGAGDKAARKAGAMKSRGEYWILLPRTINVPQSHIYKHKSLWQKAKEKFVFFNPG